MVRLIMVVFVLVSMRSALAGDAGTAAKAPAGPDGLPVFLEEGKALKEYRNVAVNPTAGTDEKPTSYPHATSNSEYNKKER